MSRAEEVEQRAAEWLTRKDGDHWSSDDQREFAAWCDSSPANAIAVARLEEIWSEANVLSGRQHPREPRSFLRRFVMPTSIAASLLAVVTGGWMWENRNSIVHRTAIGQHEDVRLADGSELALNTDTKLVAAIADGTREVWLDHGEAFFEIAHDPTHPFVVHAGKQVITVIGTKFTVRQEGQTFRLSVLTGRVRLTSLAKTEERPIFLTAGAVATSKGDDVLVSSESRHAQLDDLAWRRGTVVLDKVTLGQAVAELNRYSERKLILTDPGLSDIEIGGRFSTNNVDSFALLLSDSLKLKVRDKSNTIEIAP